MGKHSVRSKKVLPPCKYNSGVNCPTDGRMCHKCGWNPAVSKRRKGKGEQVSDHHKRLYVPRTLCELCANAYGTCSWSEKNVQRPVKGWDAIRHDVLVSARKYCESYIVLDCPLFELEEHNRWAYEKFDREAIRKRYAKEDAEVASDVLMRPNGEEDA